MNTVPNKVHKIILLNFSANKNTEAKFGFERIINSMIWSLGPLLMSSPNIISNKNTQEHWDDFKIDLLPYMFKLVSKVTYPTWLHRCRQDNQSKMTEPKPRIKICRILCQFISILIVILTFSSLKRVCHVTLLLFSSRDTRNHSAKYK